MKILMISSEATPFAKSGGLSDAVTALSRTLARRGHDVRVVIPRYYSIDRSTLNLLEGPLGVPTGGREEWAAVYESRLPESGVPVYFLDHEGFFGREGIYGNKAETDFRDNPKRFAFLARGAFQLCRKLRWIPDILHAHDWPAALVPVYRKYAEAGSEFSESASVFSIHNLGYQGSYPKDCYPSFGLPWDLFHGAGFERFDTVNMLKAGLSTAHMLTTVSPTYAREIQTLEFGCSMDGLLRARSQDLVGILNGVDLHDWNPGTDRFLPVHYSVSDLSGKAECKKELQSSLGLPENPDVPLVGMVTRLTDQKGVSELFGPTYGSAYQICSEMDLQFAVLGSGEKWCEDELESLAGRLPNFRARVGYSNETAHLIEAGSDFFMMPSRYEPCGLNQLYSLHYGTLPIAHRTGGLADTISNYNQETGAGTGFLFEQLSPRSIYDTTGWAVWAYYNKPEHVKAMRERGMKQEFSWERSAIEYEALYASALGRV